MPPIYGTICTGFERVGKREVEDKFGVSCSKERGQVTFDISMERLPKIFQLRSVDNFFAILYENSIPNLEQVDSPTALDLLRSEAKNVNWANAIDWWEIARDRKIHGGSDLVKAQMKAYIEDQKENEVTDISPKFRVTCKRLGSKKVHSFCSTDAAGTFGSQINRMFGWKADMKNFDLEIYLKIDKNNVSVMIALNKDSLFKRNVVAFGPTTMRSTVCYCMVALAEPKPGDRLLDPMCGGGSIPIEGALAFPGTSFIGGDINELALQRCHENLEHNKDNLGSSSLEFKIMDATALPYEDNYFSAVITDMPFGKKLDSIKDIYDSLLTEWQRVVVPNGKAILLTNDRKILGTIISMGNTAWKMEATRDVNIGGLTALCVVLINVSENQTGRSACLADLPKDLVTVKIT